MTLSNVDDPLERSGLAALRWGFSGLALESSAAAIAATLWRIGRWWRARGSAPPETLRIVDRRTFIVNDRILCVDDGGEICDLTTSRRSSSTPNALRSGYVL